MVSVLNIVHCRAVFGCDDDQRDMALCAAVDGRLAVAGDYASVTCEACREKLAALCIVKRRRARP